VIQAPKQGGLESCAVVISKPKFGDVALANGRHADELTESADMDMQDVDRQN